MDRLSKYILGLFLITILDFITINSVFSVYALMLNYLVGWIFILKPASL